MKSLAFGAPEVPHEISYPAVGKTALELLAQPIELVEARGPQPTPPIPFPTAPSSQLPLTTQGILTSVPLTKKLFTNNGWASSVR
jgi:hypothetical protein